MNKVINELFEEAVTKAQILQKIGLLNDEKDVFILLLISLLLINDDTQRLILVQHALDITGYIYKNMVRQE
jgi:hypothetical protein